MRRRILLAALAVPLLPACAELRTPRPRVDLPLSLVPGAEDPVRSAARLSAAAFQDQGAALEGRPAETARATARLEYLTHTLGSEPRFAALPPGLILALRGAVREVRQALGLSATALPEQVIPAMARLAQLLDARAETAAAFPAALFPAGPERSLLRLTQPGPLPEAAIATGRALEAITQLDQSNGWAGRPDTVLPR
ncbi:hypothetical protein ACFFMP_01135 [Pseudoroseomonas cervicalis]